MLRMQKRRKHPNCTAVLMETGWYHWVAVSAPLATRRWMASANVRSYLFVLNLEHYPSKYNDTEIMVFEFIELVFPPSLHLLAAPPALIFFSCLHCLCVTHPPPSFLSSTSLLIVTLVVPLHHPHVLYNQTA